MIIIKQKEEKGGRELTYTECLARGRRWVKVDVWQKPTKFCKAVILQLKNKYTKKRKKLYTCLTLTPSIEIGFYHLCFTDGGNKTHSD